MKSKDLRLIINQLERYKLTEGFNNEDDFCKWLLSLNKKQIKNLESLNIDPDLILFPRKLLINGDLLNCSDYNNRVNLMLKIKVCDDNRFLFENLCAREFLNSKHYDKDMFMLSCARLGNLRNALDVVANKVFIESKYHDEDLDLIVFANEMKSSQIAYLLSSVAKNADSINSPYHQKDMKYIDGIYSKYLETVDSYIQGGLDELATDKVSLSDEYHLENMQILFGSPVYGDLLYNIMTNETIVKSETYRDEVKALKNATSRLSARAIHFFIMRHYGINYQDFEKDYDKRRLSANLYSVVINSLVVDGNRGSDYLKYLKLLSKENEEFALYYSILFSDEKFMNNEHLEYDLKLLRSVTDKYIFEDLFTLMFDYVFLSSPHHEKDAELIKEADDPKIRDLLLRKAINEYSIKSENHEYDMNFISKMNYAEFSNSEYYSDVLFSLSSPRGINSSDHINILEGAARGVKVKKEDVVLNYLDKLRKQLPDDEKRISAKFLSKVKK